MRFGGGQFAPPQGIFPRNPGDLGFRFLPPQGDVLPSLWPPFSDLGSGIVDTTDVIGRAVATYTGATTKWTRLASGLWAEVASGSPRSYYDADLVYRGYLSEITRTNRCLWSRDLTDAAWVATNITPLKNITGIDGVANSASRITADADNGTILQAIVNASVARVYSCWMKRITGTGAVNITLDNDTTRTDVSSLINSSTWTLVQMIQTLANPTVGFKLAVSGDAVAVDMCQEEDNTLLGAGSGASTIPTTTVAVARNADSLTWDVANIDQTQSSVYIEAHLLGTQPANQVRTLIGGGSGSGRMFSLQSVGNLQGQLNDGTTTISSVLSGTPSNLKYAAAWGGATMAVSGNGVAPASGAFDGNLSMNQFSVGINSAANNSNCAFKNFRIFKGRKLSDSQLQALTV